MADHYQTLGVPKNATQADIKKAYRKLARQYHPDRNPGDESAENRFKGISVAYETLSDPEKRKHYDLVGDARPGAGGGGFRFDTDSFRSGGGIDFDDILGAFGRGRRGRQRPETGAGGSGGQPRLRPADRGDALVRRRAARRAAHDPGREAGHVLHLQRQRGPARHLPDDLSGVPRPRHQEPQPGPVLAAGAVRPLRRRRHRDRVPVPDLPRPGPHPPDQAVPRQGAARGQGRRQDPAQGQGRGRRPGRRARRPLRRRARDALAGLHPARRRPDRRRPGAVRGGRGRRHHRGADGRGRDREAEGARRHRRRRAAARQGPGRADRRLRRAPRRPARAGQDRGAEEAQPGPARRAREVRDARRREPAGIAPRPRRRRR